VAVGAPAQPAATSGVAHADPLPETTPAAPEPKKKRGFWGRLFLGNGESKDKRPEDPNKPKKPNQ
jgi:hypothetical protein